MKIYFIWIHFDKLTLIEQDFNCLNFNLCCQTIKKNDTIK